MSNKKSRKKHKYISVLSAQTPIFHSQIESSRSENEMNTCFVESHEMETDFVENLEVENDFVGDPSNKPILISKIKLDFIVAKLELTQRKSEELASFLNANNLLEPEVNVTTYRKRQASIQKYFVESSDKASAYCTDVNKLMEAMNMKYNAADWRLFIDSSKFSLKAVLLHKTNERPAVPVAYSTYSKESYDVMKTVLDQIQYSQHQWKICCDLKVVAMLCGLQGGYIKRMCFLCDWDSRFSGDQYKCHDWKDRECSKFQMQNMIEEPLVPKHKIILPPLHIKLGIVKNFIKTIAKKDEIFTCLQNIFPKLSPCKIKNGIIYAI